MKTFHLVVSKKFKEGTTMASMFERICEKGIPFQKIFKQLQDKLPGNLICN